MNPLLRRILGQMDDELARHHSRMTLLRADLDRASRSTPDNSPVPFSNFLPDQEQFRIIRLATEIAARECGVTLSRITGRGRFQVDCDARHAAWFAIRQAFPRIPLERIGREFSGREHGTILNGVAAAQILAGQDLEYASILTRITAQLASSTQPQSAPKAA